MLAWHLFWRTAVNDCFFTALAPLAVTYPFYFTFSTYRSSHQRCSVKKKVFSEISQKTCNFIKNGTLAQVFSCEFCEISNNVFYRISCRTPPDDCFCTVFLISLLLLLISPTSFKSWESIKMFLPPLKSIKYVHVSK